MLAAPELRAKRRLRLGPLWLQVLAGLVLGIALGVAAPHLAVAMRPLSDGFIRLIRTVLAPIVFATVVLGIARMGNLREVGRIGLKALVYFELVSTLSLLLSLAAADLLRPGAGMHVDPHRLDAGAISAYAATAQHHGAVAFLLGIIPDSLAGAFVSGNMLQVILIGVLLGVALVPLGSRAAPLLGLLDSLLAGLFGIVRLIMALAPLGTFGAIAFTIGRYGAASLLPLLRFTLEVWAVCAGFVLVVLGVIARLAGFSLWRLLRHLRTELLITLGTSSSEAVLAPLMLKLERLGCTREVVGLVVPAGYSFNADGTAIYLGMSALFIAQATGTDLSLSQQLVVLLVLMLTSKGSAGVAGAGFVTLAATLSAMHRIPLAGLVLLLGVDRFTNAARAATNVVGNAVATLVVARSEGALDSAGLRAGLDRPPAG